MKQERNEKREGTYGGDRAYCWHRVYGQQLSHAPTGGSYLSLGPNVVAATGRLGPLFHSSAATPLIHRFPSITGRSSLLRGGGTPAYGPDLPLPFSRAVALSRMGGGAAVRSTFLPRSVSRLHPPGFEPGIGGSSAR